MSRAYFPQDRWLTFGQYPKLKLAEALKKYGEALQRIEEGDDPADERVRHNRTTRKGFTVRQLADDYIEKYAKPRKRSWEEDDRIIKRDVLPRWGARKASSITRREVIEMLDEIVARGARVQANRTLAVVRRMFNFAVDRDVLPASPCHRMKPPSPEKSKDRYLTLDEIKTFWTRLETAPLARRTKLALKLLLVTLQRTSEVLNIHKSELDLRARTWTIPGSKTKNKRAHLVTLSPLAMEIVAELLKDMDDDGGGFLFPGEGGKGDTLTKWAISRAIARNIGHFGIAKFTGVCDLSYPARARYDRLGAIFSGVHPSKLNKRLIMGLQAFIDDSKEREDVLVLAGYFAPYEDWLSAPGHGDPVFRCMATHRSN